jgi:hypothetical protein
VWGKGVPENSRSASIAVTAWADVAVVGSETVGVEALSHALYFGLFVRNKVNPE